MLKMRIRSKVAIMITLWMFWLSMLGLYSIKLSSSSLEESYGENMVSIANVMHGTMATILANKIETLQNIETRPVITNPLQISNRQFSEMSDASTFIDRNDRIWQEHIKHFNKTPSENGHPPPLIQEILDNETTSILKEMFFVFYEKHHGRTVFSKLYLTNAFGVNIAATGLTEDYYHGDEYWWQKAVRDGIYISEIQYDKISDDAGSDEYGIYIAVRLNDKDRNLIGVVKAVLSSRWIMREVQAITDRHEYTDIKLVTEEGKLIYSNKPFNFFEDISEQPFFKKALEEKNEYSTAHNKHSTRQSGYFLVKEGGIEKLYAHSYALAHNHAKGSHLLPMENINWCIFIGNHVNRVLSPMFVLQRRMVILYAFVMLLALTIGFLIARQYTRLIIDLRNAAVAVANGDLTRSIQANMKDELGELTVSFNIMTAKLRQSYEELKEEINIRKRAEEVAEYALKKSESALQATEHARQEAESANRAKSDFLANMSHELRTPLNAIIGFSQLMEQDKEVAEGHRETIDIIMRSGKHLLNLINDILAMSKIEAGKVEIQHEDFDFFQMIQDISAMVKSRIQASGLKLFIDIDPTIPRYIKSDGQKLRQILINLLVNAFKFTKQGRVCLRIKCQMYDNVDIPPKKGVMLFEVEDTGIGISEEDIKKLFQKFMRTKTGMTTSEGTGLGLSISQEYVRLMGGEITVESQVDEGSLFKFSIEVEISDIQGKGIEKPAHQVVYLEPGEPPAEMLSDEFMQPSMVSEELMLSSSDNFSTEILSESFISDMKQALIDLDLDKMDRLIGQLAVKQPNTAREIAKLASDFKYKEIMEVLYKK